MRKLFFLFEILLAAAVAANDAVVEKNSANGEAELLQNVSDYPSMIPTAKPYTGDEAVDELPVEEEQVEEGNVSFVPSDAPSSVPSAVGRLADSDQQEPEELEELLNDFVQFVISDGARGRGHGKNKNKKADRQENIPSLADGKMTRTRGNKRNAASTAKNKRASNTKQADKGSVDIGGVAVADISSGGGRHDGRMGGTRQHNKKSKSIVRLLQEDEMADGDVGLEIMDAEELKERLNDFVEFVVRSEMRHRRGPHHNLQENKPIPSLGYADKTIKNAINEAAEGKFDITDSVLADIVVVAAAAGTRQQDKTPESDRWLQAPADAVDVSDAPSSVPSSVPSEAGPADDLELEELLNDFAHFLVRSISGRRRRRRKSDRREWLETVLTPSVSPSESPSVSLPLATPESELDLEVLKELLKEFADFIVRARGRRRRRSNRQSNRQQRRYRRSDRKADRQEWLEAIFATSTSSPTPSPSSSRSSLAYYANDLPAIFNLVATTIESKQAADATTTYSSVEDEPDNRLLNWEALDLVEDFGDLFHEVVVEYLFRSWIRSSRRSDRQQLIQEMLAPTAAPSASPVERRASIIKRDGARWNGLQAKKLTLDTQLDKSRDVVSGGAELSTLDELPSDGPSSLPSVAPLSSSNEIVNQLSEKTLPIRNKRSQRGESGETLPNSNDFAERSKLRKKENRPERESGTWRQDEDGLVTSSEVLSDFPSLSPIVLIDAGLDTSSEVLSDFPSLSPVGTPDDVVESAPLDDTKADVSVEDAVKKDVASDTVTIITKGEGESVEEEPSSEQSSGAGYTAGIAALTGMAAAFVVSATALLYGTRRLVNFKRHQREANENGHANVDSDAPMNHIVFFEQDSRGDAEVASLAARSSCE